MSREDRRKTKERYKGYGAADVNSFLERLPRDMLFVFRTWGLVRDLNRTLGGTTRERFLIMGQHAARAARRTARASDHSAWHESGTSSSALGSLRRVRRLAEVLAMELRYLRREMVHLRVEILMHTLQVVESIYSWWTRQVAQLNVRRGGCMDGLLRKLPGLLHIGRGKEGAGWDEGVGTWKENRAAREVG